MPFVFLSADEEVRAMIESKKTINVMSGSKRRSHVGVEVSKIYNPKLG